MLRQLAAVVLAYATRRLMWLWWGAYLLIVVIGVIAVPAQSKMPDGVRRILPAVWVTPVVPDEIASRKELERMIAEGRQQEIVALNCKYEWSDSFIASEFLQIGPEFDGEAVEKVARDARQNRGALPEFDRFPGLRSLNLSGCVIHREDAERISRCRSLEWLSLEQAVLVDPDLRFLAGLDRLRTLVLDTLQVSPEQPMQPGSLELPALRTLVVNGSNSETATVLRSLAASPMRDLVIGQGRTNSETVERIQAIPSLKRLFVAEIAGAPDQIRQWQEALPSVRVWPADLSQQCLMAACFIFMSTTFLVSCAQLQVQAIFSVPAARLTPNFRMPNVLVAAGILTAGILLQTGILRGYGIDSFSALAVQLFFAGIYGLTGIVTTFPRWSWPLRRAGTSAQRSEMQSGSIPPGSFANIGLVMLVFGGIAYCAMNAYIVEAYLRGNLTLWSLVCFGTGLALLCLTYFRLPQICVAWNEIGFQPALSFKDMQQYSLKSPFGPRGSDNRLMSLPRQPNPSTLVWRVRAIRAAIPKLGSVLWWSVIIGISFGIGPLFRMTRLPRVDLAPAIVPGLVQILVVMQILRFCQSWWLRRQTFSADLLYPWTRRQMTLAMFVAWGIDVGSTLVLLFALFPFANHWLGWDVSIEMFVAAGFATIASAAVLWAGMLWLLTVRHALLAVLMVFGGYVALVAILIGTTALFWGDNPGRNEAPAILVFIAVECSAIATFIGVSAYRRWMRTEWGRINAL